MRNSSDTRHRLTMPRLCGIAITALTVGLLSAVTAQPAAAAPAFRLPFTCGTTWTATTYDTGTNLRTGASWSHRNYLDFGQSGAAGKPVRASASGYARLSSGSEGKVTIDHGGGWTTVYQHMYNVNVSTAGRQVNAGEQIGTVGNAGQNTTGYHLHYAQLLNGSPQNPAFTSGTYNWSTPRTYESGGYRFTGDRYSTNQLTSDNCGGGVGEGSFVAYNGHVFRIAGGAPLYVSNWSAVGGPQPVTELNATQFNALRVYPADGTFVSVNAGFVYRFAGGAPIYVSSWDRVGGPQPTILVDQAALGQGGNPAFPWNHVRKYPADGTLVGTAPGGFVYRFAGGAPLYVSNWDAVGGPKATTQIDHAAIDQANNPSTPWNHIRRYPTNGTLVSVNAGYVYRYAGGAPIYVSTWDAIGGPAATTLVDQAALDSTATGPPWNHSRPYPADGTVLNGLGQSLSWKVTGGVARPVPRTTGVLIDTAAVANAGRAAPWNHLRTSTPMATLAPLATTRAKARAKVRWALLTTSSRTTSYDIRWRVDARPWRYPAGWQELATGPVVKTRLHVGKRYCFAIRAQNAAGVIGPWSNPRCTRRTA